MSTLPVLRDLLDAVFSASGGGGSAPGGPAAVPGGGAQVSSPDTQDALEAAAGLDHPRLPVRGTGVAGPALDAMKYGEVAATSWWEMKKAIAHKKSKIPKPGEHRGEITGGGDE